MMRCQLTIPNIRKSQNLVGGFNPSGKILVKLDLFPKLGVKIKIFETLENHHRVILLSTNICCPSPPKGCSWLKVKGYKTYCKMYHHYTKIQRINIGIYEYCVCLFVCLHPFHTPKNEWSDNNVSVSPPFAFCDPCSMKSMQMPFEFRIVLEESTRNWFPQVCASCELPTKTQSTVPSTKIATTSPCSCSMSRLGHWSLQWFAPKNTPIPQENKGALQRPSS